MHVILRGHFLSYYIHHFHIPGQQGEEHTHTHTLIDKDHRTGKRWLLVVKHITDHYNFCLLDLLRYVVPKIRSETFYRRTTERSVSTFPELVFRQTRGKKYLIPVCFQPHLHI